MKSTLYTSLLSRLKNKHSKLANRFHKSVRDGEFQKQRYRKRKDAIERLKSLEKRILGLSRESGVKTSLNYKHWAVALALGAIVATSNPVQAQEIQLSPQTILGNAYNIGVLNGDLDGDGDIDLIYVTFVDDPIVLRNEGGFSFTESTVANTDGVVNDAFLSDFDGDNDLDIFMRTGTEGSEYTYQVWLNDGAANFSPSPVTLPAIQFNDNKFFTGDIDADGDADLVIEKRLDVAPYTQIPTVLESSFAADGTFTFSESPVTLPNGAIEGYLVALSDVDLDGDLDIAFTGYNGGASSGYALMALSNDGLGGFTYATGQYTYISNKTSFREQSDTLDIDNDGDADILNDISSYPNTILRLYTNDGSDVFTFSSANTFNINANRGVGDIQTIDINDDNLDEFLINTQADSAMIFQTFAGAGTQQIAKFPGAGLLADMDSDGNADFLSGGGSIYIDRNEGGGSFVSAANLLTISAVYDIDTVDIDNDSDLDIVTASESLPSRVWENDGFGNFTVKQVLAGRAYDHAFGDLDGDGDYDMVRTIDGGGPGPQLGFEIWVNDAGTLSLDQTIGAGYGPGSFGSKRVFLENIDTDSDLDIIMWTEEEIEGTYNYLRTFRNDGGLVFTENTSNVVSLSRDLQGMDVGDFDNDGDTDVALAINYMGTGNTVEFLANDGSGTFSSSGGFMASASYGATDVDLVDLDGDLISDLLVTSGQDHLVFFNNGDGTNFGTGTQVFTQYVYRSFVGDLDNDGDNDVVFGGYATNPTIFLNDGAGVLTLDGEIQAIADEYTSVVAADLDGDGDNDIVFGGYYTGLKLFFNESVIPEPEINVQGNGIDIAAGDTTPDLADGTDFGTVAPGASQMSTFTIQNLGGASLDISDVTISATDGQNDVSSDFLITGITPPTSINPTSSVSFDVTYSPTTPATVVGSLLIANNDADEFSYPIGITAVAKVPGISEQDSTALLAIYNTLGGTNWTINDNWLVDGTRANEWAGVVVENERVTKLFLSGNNLTGTLPSEIGNLTALTDLYMANNALSGAIPPEIGLTSLDTLVMSGNQLTSIPDELYDLTSLIRLSISQNNIEGTIPPSIANLTNLNFVALWSNPFTGGTIPEEFWTMTALEQVFIGSTGLSGDISQFTNLTNLIQFWMDESNFTGTISSDIGNLTNLELLNVSENMMTGSLPAELATLSNLTEVHLEGNSFSDLPDFSSLTLDSLKVSLNNFDFVDLEPNVGVAAGERFVYAPQNDETAGLEISINGGNSFMAVDTTTSAGNAVTLTGLERMAPSNQYTWTLATRMGTAVVPSQTEIAFPIPSIGRLDQGRYQLTVSNPQLPDLTFVSDDVEILANAILTLSATDADTEVGITENINAYLFSLDLEVPDTVEFVGDPNLNTQSEDFVFPPVVLGRYLVAAESTIPLSINDGEQNPNATYIPTFFGDEFLSINADTLFLESDSTITIEMEEFPDPSAGEGLVSGTIEEDFPEETSRIDARRRAKKRKCGLRRRVSGGRVDQDDFELIAYGETNDNGEFEYGFLPQGTYQFFVEYPGIPIDESAFVEFVIGPAGISDDEFTLAVFASPEGIQIEFVLGISSDYFTDLSIYPNPASDVITVEYAELRGDQVTMELISLEGQVLHSRTLDKSKKKIQYDTSLLKQGMYLLRFRGNDNTEPLVYRIIKK